MLYNKAGAADTAVPCASHQVYIMFYSEGTVKGLSTLATRARYRAVPKYGTRTHAPVREPAGNPPCSEGVYTPHAQHQGRRTAAAPYLTGCVLTAAVEGACTIAGWATYTLPSSAALLPPWSPVTRLQCEGPSTGMTPEGVSHGACGDPNLMTLRPAP
ncbi:hypothetical protein NDU88_008360 [Pleurodeles waltl]|uniref:Uncharacterized protein n=1 Tax=Pleurodeles waltl TaxID=8319 RepID=A0AAV7QNA6_PLEWA|nr:hypothetical protein NDU88_008360 [Pleurodeles waltl]